MELKELRDEKLSSHLKTIAPDGIWPFLLDTGHYRGAFISGTLLVNQMRANHNLGLLETLVLGHAYLAAGLLSILLKDQGKYGLLIECGGPIKGLSVEADFLGNIRGRLFANPIAMENPPKDLDMNLLFGPGFLTLTRYDGRDFTPFSGQIMMEYGSIAQDLALYFRQSEQTPSVFSLSIQFDEVGRVMGAGGLFLQLMPGAPEDSAGDLEDKIVGFESLGKFLAGTAGEKNPGEAVPRFIERQFADFSPALLPEKPARFFCGCDRRRFLAFLSSMKDEDRDSFRSGPFPLVVDCQNCGTSYGFEREELEAAFSGNDGPAGRE